ncbi:hypothetical protein Halru_1844 [Halovivax ruber XH-70]|uniref:Uncharacterized protein n=1 Tax=Halovivax ruber (strain DSM 18193 / JCM 13892 / XH-70) TaxID=797302 RepID=L0IC92_HALRX|nr:hypothetical protein Halru_1844 [Halovivax ruber XH-70]
MDEWVLRGFLSVFAVQLLGAVLVYFDAHRQNVKQPVVYMSFVLTPIIGLIIGFGYLFGRKSLPRWPENETPAQSENRTQMKTEIAYFLGILVLFASIGIVRTVYLS